MLCPHFSYNWKGQCPPKGHLVESRTALPQLPAVAKKVRSGLTYIPVEDDPLVRLSVWAGKISFLNGND